ncbi:hypothetical protein NEOLI_002766 [Neolecta irregularis DAH-3]|uniref:Uncharacterized protein n=1 Tax=Neolecta irregularis (strain DAH-3) TaxID=1198029 RepID=A0A1U7LS75_NEOID|nr:hypothetical protein NEOLI_002766 [Neolecta irregularis DAH-3]|eukprot:OLL25479.1 hypothetical protein NEOLI_002766 [Neolecta irregularis DAH-3]
MEAPRVIENIKVVPNPIQCPVHRVPTAILKAELCFTTIETVVLSRLSGGLYAHFHDESGVEDDEEAYLSGHK